MYQSSGSAGFTLIELMIVVAIIAILAAIAIPAYQDYVIRSQVSEGIVLADGARLEVWNFYAQRGTLPGNNASADLPSATSISGKFASSVQVIANGQIVVTYAGARAIQAIFNGQLGLTPNVGGNAGLVWTCSALSGINQRYIPTLCRTGSN